MKEFVLMTTSWLPSFATHMPHPIVSLLDSILTLSVGVKVESTCDERKDIQLA